MPKSSKEQIDIDEKKIIIELKRNSKENIDTIAKRCGFSRQKVWRIIKRLEKNKTIWGYSAVVDKEKLNIKRYIMLIKRSSAPASDAISKIIDLTAQKKGLEIGVDVECSSYLHGEYDWMIIFTTNDIKNAKRFNEIINKEYHQIIRQIHIIEDIFSVKKCGQVNPEIHKLKEFISGDI
jgi:DNA-binding Lrp family transcriptional regulator